MIRISIPRDDRAPLAELVQMPEEERQSLLSVLRSQRPHLNPSTLAQRVSPETGIAVDRLERYFGVLGSMALSLKASGVEFDQILPDLQRILKTEASATGASTERKGEGPTLDQLEAFKKFAVAALDLSSALGASIKGYDLLTDAERPFARARILSDVRHVFADGQIGAPAAAVVVHTLRIDYSNRGPGSDESVFLELDAKDLDSLKRVVDRAIQKDKELRRFYADRIQVLEE